MCLGIPGQVVEISDEAKLRAKVDVEGIPRDVSLALIGLGGPEGACVGDWVVVHVGFAMARIDAAEANEALDGLAALGDMYTRALGDRSPDE
ncbi:MAG: HypC/HybG/HupF family hydrogenase formation chaperone [Nocardioidaceae bacterium]|nr:HypC/HybG/HupF family hydrogenase formation chaperone [Nocardioidaceae bacterium]